MHRFGEQVTGILFEMKVDYTTWFGAETEFIHGIQVDALPASFPKHKQVYRWMLSRK